MKKTVTNKLDKITAQIIEKLESGVNPWVKPWRMLREKKQPSPEALKHFAYNYVSNLPYSFLNQQALKPGYYLTFKQVKELGGNVKKGARASFVLYTNSTQREAKPAEVATAKATLQERSVLFELHKYFSIYPLGTVYFTSDNTATIYNFVNKDYAVFNLEDCENVREIKRTSSLEEIVYPEHEEIDALILDYMNREGINFVNDRISDRAFFRHSLLSEDNQQIVLPMKRQFKTIEEYYSTAFHEMTHSTGMPSRLNREAFKPGNNSGFGSMSYSREELVAEMGACYAIGYLGLDAEKTEKNSAAYLRSWASKLMGELKDKIVIASNQAAKAFNFIFELEEYATKKEETNKEEKTATVGVPDLGASARAVAHFQNVTGLLKLEEPKAAHNLKMINLEKTATGHAVRSVAGSKKLLTPQGLKQRAINVVKMCFNVYDLAFETDRDKLIFDWFYNYILGVYCDRAQSLQGGRLSIADYHAVSDLAADALSTCFMLEQQLGGRPAQIIPVKALYQDEALPF